MSERLRGERLKRAFATGLVGALALFAAGCGGTTSRAENSTYGDCSPSKSLAYQGYGDPVSPSFVTGTEIPLINRDLKTLRRRAKLIDGKIDISNARGLLTLSGYDDNSEIHIENGRNIRLRFNSEDPWQDATRDVLFSSSSPSADFKISPGSIACTVGQKVYRNRVDQSITTYTDATKNLH